MARFSPANAMRTLLTRAIERDGGPDVDTLKILTGANEVSTNDSGVIHFRGGDVDADAWQWFNAALQENAQHGHKRGTRYVHSASISPEAMKAAGFPVPKGLKGSHDTLSFHVATYLEAAERRDTTPAPVKTKGDAAAA